MHDLLSEVTRRQPRHVRAGGSNSRFSRARLLAAFAPRQSIAPSPPRWTQWLLPYSVAVVLAAVVAKSLLLPFAVSSVSQFARWLLRLAIVLSPDVCFVAGVTAFCGLIALATRGWPRIGRAWRLAVGVGYCLAATYAVASVPMYKVTMVPFSIRLLSFAGGPGVMASSVRPFLSPALLTVLALAPLSVVLAPWAAPRLAKAWRPRLLDASASANSLRRVWPPIAALLIIACYGAACRTYIRSRWTDPNRWERRIAQSPHGVLLASCLEELLKDQPFTANYSFGPIDVSDFRQPASESPALPPLALAGPRPKNVVLIVLESVGAEYVGLNGSRFDTTPRLERHAAERGIVFENIYAQAVSSCKSIVSLSASVYPRPDWLLILRDNPAFDVPFLAETLQQHGYRTCYAHAGYWSWQRRDVFLKQRGIHVVGAEDHQQDRINSWGVPDRKMYQDVLNWIDQDPARPFFAYAYTIETHHPYVAPRDCVDFGVDDPQFARYLNAVRAADREIDFFLAELERRGLADDTLVAITGDHGESFGQHNQRVHSFGIYEPTVHVPLVLLHPSLANLPRRQPEIGQHIDIAPTILHLLGIAAPNEWQGRSLLDGRTASRAYFLCVGNEVAVGLREGNFKYHCYVDTTREELFDLSTDPAEERNLADANPQRCAEYRRRVGGLVNHQRHFLAQHGAP